VSFDRAEDDDWRGWYRCRNRSAANAAGRRVSQSDEDQAWGLGSNDVNRFDASATQSMWMSEEIAVVTVWDRVGQRLAGVNPLVVSSMLDTTSVAGVQILGCYMVTIQD
jgi:hypothetical protein